MPSYRFGKHPRKSDYRTLRFKNYVTTALPLPPASLNLLDRVYAKVGTSDPTQLPITQRGFAYFSIGYG